MIDPDTMGKPPQIVKVPTLLIWGSQDHALGVDMAHQSARYYYIPICIYLFLLDGFINRPETGVAPLSGHR